MDDGRREKVDLAWAAVFMSAVATVALTLLFTFSGGTTLDLVTGMDLIVGWTISVLSVVLLLTTPGASKVLLVCGRVMVWMAFCSLAVAGALGILSMFGVG